MLGSLLVGGALGASAAVDASGVASPGSSPAAPMAITESWAQLAALGATADGIFVKPTFLLVAADRSRAGCAGAAEAAVARFEQFLDAAPSREALAVGIADAASATFQAELSAFARSVPHEAGGAEGAPLLPMVAPGPGGGVAPCFGAAFFGPGMTASAAAHPSVFPPPAGAAAAAEGAADADADGAAAAAAAAAADVGKWAWEQIEIDVGFVNQHTERIDLLWHEGGDGTDGGFGGGSWIDQGSVRAPSDTAGEGFQETWVNSFVGARFRAVEASSGLELARIVARQSGAAVIRTPGVCLPARATPKRDVPGEDCRGAGVSAAAKALGRHAAAMPLPQPGLSSEIDTPAAPCDAVQDPAFVDMAPDSISAAALARTHADMEASRHQLNEQQPAQLPTFTKVGFEKRRMPAGIWQRLLTFYRANRGAQVLEEWPLGNTYTNHYEVPILQVPMSWSLKHDVHESLRPVVEAWSGAALKQTDCYGIRVYQKGSVLRSHVDRIATHAVSLILNIDQAGPSGEEGSESGWPLEILDHDGVEHRVRMQPGDMVLYESARCRHARETPFNGTYFTNAFVHYMPVEGWEYG